MGTGLPLTSHIMIQVEGYGGKEGWVRRSGLGRGYLQHFVDVLQARLIQAQRDRLSVLHGKGKHLHEILECHHGAPR